MQSREENVKLREAQWYTFLLMSKYFMWHVCMFVRVTAEKISVKKLKWLCSYHFYFPEAEVKNEKKSLHNGYYLKLSMLSWNEEAVLRNEIWKMKKKRRAKLKAVGNESNGVLKIMAAGRLAAAAMTNMQHGSENSGNIENIISMA